VDMCLKCIWVPTWGRRTYSVGYPARCALAGRGSTGEPIAAYLLLPPDFTLENPCCWSFLPSISGTRWSNLGLFQWCINCNSILERVEKGLTRGTQVLVACGSLSGHHGTSMCPVAGAVRAALSSLARAGQKNCLADETVQDVELLRPFLISPIG